VLSWRYAYSVAKQTPKRTGVFIAHLRHDEIHAELGFFQALLRGVNAQCLQVSIEQELRCTLIRWEMPEIELQARLLQRFDRSCLDMQSV
jgi:hypothetical protein